MTHKEPLTLGNRAEFWEVGDPPHVRVSQSQFSKSEPATFLSEVGILVNISGRLVRERDKKHLNPLSLCVVRCDFRAWCIPIGVSMRTRRPLEMVRRLESTSTGQDRKFPSRHIAHSSTGVSH